MGRGVGRLNFEIVAKMHGFNEGMRQARRQIQKFKKRVDLTSKAMRLFGTYLAASRVAGFVRAQAQAIDKLAKLSDRVGESTERLAGLQHAADITGAGAAKMAAGIDVLQKRLGEAKMGMGEGKAALDKLGLSVQDLLRMSPADQFARIADRVKALSSRNEKAAVTAKLFSRANQDLVNTLELGSQGLDKMRQRAKTLGLGPSRAEAAKVEAMNDAATRLRGAFAGCANVLVVEVAPALTQVAKGIEQIVTKVRENKKWLALAWKVAHPWEMLAGEEEKWAGPGPGALGGGARAGAERMAAGTADLAKRAGSIMSGLMPEREALLAQFEKRFGVIQNAMAQELVTWEEGSQAIVRLVQEREDEIKRIEEEGRKARLALREKEIRGIGAWASAFERVASVTATTSRRAFDAHKKLAVAEAITNTAAGITRALRDNTWTRWGEVAAVAAAGYAQIAQIRATTFEGGGAVAATSPGGEAVAAEPAATPTNVNVTLHGSSFGAGSIRDLIEAINEAVGDGYNLTIG